VTVVTVGLLTACVGLLTACAGLRPVETRPVPSPTGPPTASTPDDTSVDATAPVTTAPGSPEVFEPDPRRPPQPYDEALSAAILDIEAFWRTTFPKVYGADFPDVQGGIWPVFRGRRGVPGCGAAQTRYADIEGNAFYCPEGDFLAWDEQLMDAGYRQIGDAWVYLVIAHEWGHAIQARLRRDQVSVAAELQADCLAGATLQGSVDDGDLILEPGDTQEIADTLVAVADDYPWSDSSSHGDAQERTNVFSTGAQGGLRACV